MYAYMDYTCYIESKTSEKTAVHSLKTLSQNGRERYNNNNINNITKNMDNNNSGFRHVKFKENCHTYTLTCEMGCSVWLTTGTHHKPTIVPFNFTLYLQIQSSLAKIIISKITRVLFCT